MTKPPSAKFRLKPNTAQLRFAKKEKARGGAAHKSSKSIDTSDAPHPQTPSPREFGSRLMKLQSGFIRILEERGLSGCLLFATNLAIASRATLLAGGCRDRKFWLVGYSRPILGKRHTAVLHDAIAYQLLRFVQQ